MENLVTDVKKCFDKVPEFDKLNSQLTPEAKEKFMKTQSEEQEYIAAIQKKYGDGTLDPETGVFTQNKPVAPK